MQWEDAVAPSIGDQNVPRCSYGFASTLMEKDASLADLSLRTLLEAPQRKLEARSVFEGCKKRRRKKEEKREKVWKCWKRRRRLRM